jgi:tRNA A-37 threonylcarbamoyl transferase component Bud32
MTTTFLSPDRKTVLKKARKLAGDPFRFDTITRAWNVASGLGLTPALLRSERSRSSTFFEYEFVEGMDLYEWWSLHHDDAGRVSNVRRSVRTILHKLHRAGIVFGDVNAGNLIVDQSDRVWIVDWDTVSMFEDDFRAMELMFDRLRVVTDR